MSLKNWSTTASSNNSAPPNGAPESTTTLADTNDIMRQIMADVRTLAASDTIASAATCDIGTKDNTFLTVTGTTAITALGTVSAGIWKVLVFDDALTFTHNATSLILPAGANITTAAGDTAFMLSLGSGNWRCIAYNKKSGIATDPKLAAIAALAVTDGNIIVGDGSTWVAESGATARTSLGLAIGTNVAAYDADALFADTTDALVAGYTATSTNAGTKSSGTYTPTVGNSTSNFQYAVNGGAHTLAPPVGDCTVVIQYTNNASAGAITTSGWTKVSGAFTTTDGDDFMVYGTVIGAFSHLTIVALQ